MARVGSEFTAGYHRAHPPSAPASPTIGATSRRPRTASAAADPERAAERFLEEHRGFGVGAGAGIEGGFEPRFDARPGTSAGADAVAATLSRAAALASAPSPSRLAAAYGSYPAPQEHHPAEAYRPAEVRDPRSAPATPAPIGYAQPNYPHSVAASPARSDHAHGYYSVAHASAASRHDAHATGFQHAQQLAHQQQLAHAQQLAHQHPPPYQHPHRTSTTNSGNSTSITSRILTMRSSRPR